MDVAEEKKKVFGRVAMMCCLWYILSAISNNSSKSLLKEFPFPITVSFVQALSVVLYMPLAMKFLGVKRQPVSRQVLKTQIFPLALLRVLASASSATSLLKVPVSYAHTVKAIQPVCTVFLSTFVLGEKPTLPLLLSLVPVVLGVILASCTELQFDFFGMMCALFSTVTFATQNIYSKKIMRQHVLDHFNILYNTTYSSMIMLFCIWLYTDVRGIMNTPTDKEQFWSVFWKLFVTGFSNFGQSLTAFSVLFLISPLSYSVANTTKRIVVISTSIFVFRNPVTNMNLLGMCMAIGGVALYNKAKYDAAKKITSTQLPGHGSNFKPIRVRADSHNDLSPFVEYGDQRVIEVADSKFHLLDSKYQI